MMTCDRTKLEAILRRGGEMSDERHTISADEKVRELFAENTRLREALALYREAVRTDVLMEGVRFKGSDFLALKRAWEADRAALAKEAGR